MTVLFQRFADLKEFIYLRGIDLTCNKEELRVVSENNIIQLKGWKERSLTVSSHPKREHPNGMPYTTSFNI